MEINNKRVIVFVCEHGAAKSILAAAYFNHFAKQSGLEFEAIARGTNPDPEISQQTVAGLSMDGLKPSESVPQKLSTDDIQSAERIIGFCDLPSEVREPFIVEQWEGIPAVSEDYDKARDAILERINYLIHNLRSSS
jgi:protein-tyrosine-phosphatase